MTFVRFNPNSYYDKTSKLITCNLKAVYLYYDGFDEANSLTINYNPYKL